MRSSQRGKRAGCGDVFAALARAFALLQFYGGEVHLCVVPTVSVKRVKSPLWKALLVAVACQELVHRCSSRKSRFGVSFECLDRIPGLRNICFESIPAAHVQNFANFRVCLSFKSRLRVR